MQYILTEEEYNNTVLRDDYEALKLAHEILWKHYCSIANPSCKGSEIGECRCDNCPISSLSLTAKPIPVPYVHLSRIDPLPYDIARLVCFRKNQQYSK